MKFKTRLSLKTHIIDPVPLFDIILQFMIFFLLSAEFIGKPGLVLELPQAGIGTLYKPSGSKITVTGDKLFFQDREISVGQLKGELNKGLINMLVIDADKDIPYSRIVEVIDLAKQAGVKEIAIATESAVRGL